MGGGKDDLEIDESVPFQRREWRAQRIGWFVSTAILVAALAGLLGPGPLSSATASATRFSVQYLRFSRWQAPQTVIVRVPPSNKALELSINRSYLDSMQVQQITPQPTDVRLSGGDSRFVFDVEGASSPTDIAFDLQPSSMGTVHARIGLVSSGRQDSLDLTQLVYP